MRFSARDVWVVVAARNEARVIGQVVAELRRRFDHVIVVDDGSSDETGSQANLYGATVLRHAINRGQGAALQTGISHALAQHAKFIATFDADGQHDPNDVIAMLDALRDERADIALGSRFLGHAPGMSRGKGWLLKTATLFQKLTTGVNLTDAHNGLRLFTSAAARRITIEQDRMAHASEIVAKIGKLRLKVIEVPCTIRYTEYSVAKGQRISGSLQILLDLGLRRIRS